MKHFCNLVLLPAAALSVLVLALMAGVTVNSASWGPLPPPPDDGFVLVAWGPLPPPPDDGFVSWGPLPPPPDDGFIA